MADRDEFGAFLIGFVVGGLTGAAVALLLAPQSGEETRVYIKDRAIELADKASETAQTVSHEVENRAGEVKVKAEELAGKAKTSVEDLRHRGAVVLEEQKTKITEAVQAIKPKGETAA
ncbi:MAG: YtxH domain-containing protein [Anaerolineaceae bacterium]|nr:YtxH domain-containing protein [Anaerolineaceae bacterium]